MVSQISATAPAGSTAEAGNTVSQNEKDDKSPEKSLTLPASDQPSEREIDKREINLGDTVVAFDVDFQSKEVVIKIMDKESREIIREIPPETLRKVAEMISDASGQLLDKKV